ncbi:hypothetical protein DITRI_Ditri11bG0065400 [Diplodiscus trichospermus]
MGKYMKKSKITGDIVVMEVSHQSTMGSRARAAKTLALQRLQKTSPSPSPAKVVASTPDVSSFSYLQLRSRRLEKLPSLVSNDTKQKQQGKESSFREEKRNGEKKREGCFGENREIALGVGLCSDTEEASFGENNLDFGLRDRSTRESTPCSLIKDSETIATPGSTTRLRSSPSTQRRGWNDVQRSIPTTHEMEEFFASAEQQQQRQFIGK